MQVPTLQQLFKMHLTSLKSSTLSLIRFYPIASVPQDETVDCKMQTAWLTLCPETSLMWLLMQLMLPWHKMEKKKKKLIYYSLDIDQGDNSISFYVSLYCSWQQWKLQTFNNDPVRTSLCNIYCCRIFCCKLLSISSEVFYFLIEWNIHMQVIYAKKKLFILFKF